MEARQNRHDKTGCVLAMLLGMAFAEGCGPPTEDRGGTRLSARTALVASVSPYEGQAFVVGALIAPAVDNADLRRALQQAGEAHHLILDIHAMAVDEPAQNVQMERWQPRQADALLVCAPNEPAAQSRLLRTAASQIPVVTMQWENAQESRITLFHNGRATDQTLAASPPALAQTAVATLAATLRGEKVKPPFRTESPTF